MTPPEKPKLFTIAGRCGRLANRLLVFAKFAAYAEEHGHRLINFTFHSYSELFEGTRENIYCRYPRPKRRSWFDLVPGVAAALRHSRILFHLNRGACVLNERFPIFGSRVATMRELPDRRTLLLDDPEYQEKIRPARVVFAYGCWLTNPSLVQKHGEKLRAYFKPVEKFETASRAAIDSLRREAEVVVGVHIRQGDYRVWVGGKFFFPVARYAAWMAELAAQFPNRKVAFFVCSDEPRSAGEFPGLTVGLGTGSPVSDIYALARCDYIFGTKSTFSQWASFYGEKPLLQISGQDAAAKLENFRVSYLDWI
jgi:hypothetical protein